MSERFDFDFEGRTREQVLSEAGRAINALSSDLGPDAGRAVASDHVAARLLAELDAEIAEFSPTPEFVRLTEASFAAVGMKPPALFTELSAGHRFYWMQLPMTLRPQDGKPFVKLQCAVEFNPAAAPGAARPVAQMVLPDRRFQDLLEVKTHLTIGLGEDFTFKANVEGDPPASGDGVGGKLAVDGKLAAGADLVAGPFSYAWRRAKVDNHGTGSPKVFWTLDGAEFFQEHEPVLAVVLRVPNEVDELHVTAAMQATHEYRILAASIGNVLSLLGERIANFFRAGAPAMDTQTWDLTGRL